MKYINSIVLWWMTVKFPLVHLSDKTPFFKKWFFHPIKRRLARWYLKILQKLTSIKVIAITGSSGKTTTKEMLASILKNDGKTSYTKENIDPIYNIPSTILKTPPGTKYLILEMGVEYPGEMDFYVWLARPDVGVILNIFPTHLEFMGSVDGVFNEKSKLVRNLGKGGRVILNSGDEKLKTLAKEIKTKVFWFSMSENPMEQNSSAASAIAGSLGLSQEKIDKGLSNYQKPKHRLSLIRSKNGAEILDDTYNSNPNAALSALRYFESLSTGRIKVAVLGEMKELGEFEELAHRGIGREILKHPLDLVVGVGGAAKYVLDEINKNSKAIKTVFVDSSDQVLPLLKPYDKKGCSIFLKGSRSVGLDKVVDKLV